MDKLYTIIEVATKLNLSNKTLRRWEEAGRFIPSRTLGNQRRYSLEDLQILDAIKHGTINEQKDLLTIDQAAKLCGVSSTTIVRWENEGKIHPLITSGNTYYPRQKLEARMDELKKIYVEPEPVPDTPGVKGAHTPGVFADPAPIPQRTVLKRNPWLQAKEGSLASERTVLNGTLTNALITLLLLLTYHFFFNSPPTSIVPLSGSVQGTSNISPQDTRLDDLIIKFNDYVSTQMLKDAKPAPTTVFQLPNTLSLITGTFILPKGKNQISVTQEQITPNTPVTLVFTNDYSPAKKYWVTVNQGSFTLHTDFPVTQDSPFNYNFITPTSTTSAIIQP
ncbi:hypothetical protein COT87_01440 [Candidatus Collierbacteria bacterium CG10_big_fil_rev_8_21_14_0_10_44_9]|uniref:HTH merR-type domain-containing protein n=1 Tax=Candidatus Collierbacteria bacterium CG10_big_fil_rev_8_21_14_0_10_44_9 TaxID=1974535 RepID=A0A2H0VIY2_9BACT|nr:MAG: hypothetical protein COT87_01440 [Candidatus Collierbacteria bacterium CG10_big_fil_rev_8_21_14_0_10_44_9]